MKINDKILSIPPFISTYWSNVSALHMRGSILVVSLLDGETIELQKLSQSTIDSIFEAHVAFLENEDAQDNKAMAPTPSSMMHQFSDMLRNDPQNDPVFRMTIGTLDELGSVLNHNSQQANSPDIPQEILEKIVAITKIISPEDMNLPKAEPHCNCTHCQIARSLGQIGETQAAIPAPSPVVKESEEEIVSEKDLNFQQWDINHSGNQLYSVVNRLDTQEKYSVYLGNPVGCTCGNSNCEHIIAVLKS